MTDEQLIKGIAEWFVESETRANITATKVVETFDVGITQARKALQYMASKGYLKAAEDGICDYPEERLYFRRNIELCLVEPDVNAKSITNNYINGNGFIANGDIHIIDSTIAETVNNAQGIPEELKAELTEFLTYLKDSHSPLADKQIKVGVFLDKVKNLFGDVVTGVASNLIVAAMSGQLPILPL